MNKFGATDVISIDSVIFATPLQLCLTLEISIQLIIQIRERLRKGSPFPLSCPFPSFLFEGMERRGGGVGG